MQAQDVLNNLNGWNKVARIVNENELPDIIRQGGSGDCCDCKGCDKG